MMSISQMKQELVNDFGYEKSELKYMSNGEVKSLYEDCTDTSILHPNETFEEFMEHEDF